MVLLILILCLPVSSADNLCKKYGPKSGPTKCRALSGSKLFDDDGIPEICFLKKLIKEKINRQQKRMQNYPAGKELVAFVKF